MKLAPWLTDAWQSLAAALAAARLHHGLLFAAPAGLGKRALAGALAAAALCEQRGADGHACGSCRSCVLLAAGSHPDFSRTTFGTREDGKPRSEIIVDQIRALSERLAMASQYGGAQIALIDPADRLNANAANALLKTLEEPTPATILMLIADDASRLPATIRSRCQRIDICAPAHSEALAWLRAQGVAPARAEESLAASLGNPGLALAWSADETLALRSACAADLAALSSGRRHAAEVAERWAADQPELRLWFAAALARDEAGRLARGESGAYGLTTRAEMLKLTAWFTHAMRVRGLLATPLRSDLVVLDALRAWPLPASIARST